MIEHAGDTTLTQVYNLRKSRKRMWLKEGYLICGTIKISHLQPTNKLAVWTGAFVWQRMCFTPKIALFESDMEVVENISVCQENHNLALDQKISSFFFSGAVPHS